MEKKEEVKEVKQQVRPSFFKRPSKAVDVNGDEEEVERGESEDSNNISEYEREDNVGQLAHENSASSLNSKGGVPLISDMARLSIKRKKINITSNDRP